MQQYLSGTTTLTASQIVACDVDTDFQVTSTDHLKLLPFITPDENGNYSSKSIY